MRGLQDSVALAVPLEGVLRPSLEAAIMKARARRQGPEVRLGTGPLASAPLRVLGFADLAREVVERDAMVLASPPRQVVLFSSAPKLAALAGGGWETSPAATVMGLAALAGALRLVGMRCDLKLEEAVAGREVPAELDPAICFSSSLEMWLAERQVAHPEADARSYAIEHASPSMFGDLALSGGEEPLFRVTVGPRPESRFFAARVAVAEAAYRFGVPVVPGLGLILRGSRRPWYQPMGFEPMFSDLVGTSLEAMTERLRNAVSPERGGNPGLKREMHRTSRIVVTSLESVMKLGEHLAGPASAARFLRSNDFSIGPRLQQTLAAL